MSEPTEEMILAGIAASPKVPQGVVKVAWQPIATAPTDNRCSLYLARFVEGRLVEIDFDGAWERLEESWEMPHINGWAWVSANGIESPTHWAYQDQEIPPVSEGMVLVPLDALSRIMELAGVTLVYQPFGSQDRQHFDALCAAVKEQSDE